MVKLKISSALFFLSFCSLSILPACTFNGPHKPVQAGDSLGKPDGGGSGGSGGGDTGGAIVSYSDVKSIFETRCASCHLMNHKWAIDQATAEGKRDVIKTRVEGRTMPMVGSEQAKAITDNERAKIVAWATGKPLGGGNTALPVQGSVKGGSVPTKTQPDRVEPTPVVVTPQTQFVKRCQNCHGAQGFSPSEFVPNLAGSDSDYLLARLFYFSRPDAIGTMMPEQIKALAKEFNLKDEKDKATMDLLKSAVDYFSKQKLPVTAAEKAAERGKLSTADAEKYAKGQKIVASGNCVTCHLTAEVKPTSGTPMIFSQKYEFLLQRFKDFLDKSVDDTAGKRTGDQTMPGVLESLMKDQNLKESDLDAVAYYLHLTAPEEIVPAAAAK
jgi:mono/diheme cytochrome c family protein